MTEQEPTVGYSTEECPACGVSWVGELVPEESKHLYDSLRFKRQIAVYDRDRDMTSHFICPDCQKTFRRTGT